METNPFTGLNISMMREFRAYQSYRNDSSPSSNFHISTRYKSNAKHSSILTNSSGDRQSCSHSTETCLDVYKLVLKHLADNREVMAEVKRLLLKRKKHTFGSVDALDTKIEGMLGKSRKLMEDTESQIQEALNLLTINSGSRTRTLIGNMKTCLSGQIGVAAKELRKIEQLYLSIKSITVSEHTDEKSEFSFISRQSTNDHTQVLYDEGGNSLIMSEIEQAEASNELKAIFRNIDSLSKLLQDMSAMAVTQGTLIDRIDINISSTLESVKRTNDELVVCADMMRNDLTSKCTKWLIVLNVCIFVLLLIKHAF